MKTRHVVLAAGALPVLVLGLAAYRASSGPGAEVEPKALTPEPILPKPGAKPAPDADYYGDALPEGALARMGSARLRHAGASNLVFAADSKSLLTFGRDQTIRTWDLADGKQRRKQTLALEGVDAGASWLGLALSPDAATAARISREHLHIWEAAGGKERHRVDLGKLESEKMISALEFSPDGKTLAVANYEGVVRLWDATTGKESGRLQHPERRGPCFPVFAPDGKQLAAAGETKIALWDLSSGKALRTLETERLARAVFSPDGKTLAVCGARSVVLLDAASGAKEADVPLSKEGPHRGACQVGFSPDGKTLAVGSANGVVLRDRATLKALRKLTDGDFGPLAFSPDGKTLATVVAGIVILWDVETGKWLQHRPSHTAEPSAAAYSPDGKRLASATMGDHSVRLWDAATGRPLRALPVAEDWVRHLSFSADGRKLVSCGDQAARMWDLASGKEERVFTHPGPAKGDLRATLLIARLSEDGKQLATVHEESDDLGARQVLRVSVWDVAGGKRTEGRPWSGSSRPQFSADGKRVALAAGKELIVHELAADREVGRLPGHLFAPAALSPDGRLAALGGIYSGGPRNPEETGREREERRRAEAEGETVRVCDVASGAEWMKLETGPVWFKAFTPDGRYLVTAGERELRLWEVATGKGVLRRPMAEYPRGLAAMAFATCLAVAPDGRSVASGLTDGNLLVWDLAPATRRRPDLKAADLDRLWADLAGADARTAYRAAGLLIAAPDQAVTLLRKVLEPAAADDKRIARLIADLDSDRFAERSAAKEALEEVGEIAEPALRKALANKPSDEQRRALVDLLPAPGLVRSPEVLRRIRAVQILEGVGGDEARALLKRLGEGAAGARQTREARAALGRLDRRTPSGP